MTSKGKVFLLDDEELIVSVLSKALRSEGYTIEAATETIGVLDKIKSWAPDVVLLDTSKVCSFADYFIVCSGESDRQIEAICDAIDEAVKGQKLVHRRREGTPGSGWVLMDMGNIIVHIFAPFEREYYRLEDLWSRAPVVVKMI